MFSGLIATRSAQQSGGPCLESVKRGLAAAGLLHAFRQAPGSVIACAEGLEPTAIGQCSIWTATEACGSPGAPVQHHQQHRSRSPSLSPPLHHRLCSWPPTLPFAAARCFAHDSKKPWQQRGAAQQQQPRPPPPRAGGRGGDRKKPAPRRNEEIRAPEVRVILPDGGNQVLPLPEALAVARAHGLDLVEVPGTRNPLVAKVADWSQIVLAQRKAEEEAARRERVLEKLSTPKEVQFTARIEDHDLEIKLRKVKEFLEDGRKVNLVVKHRPREGDAASGGALDYILERLGAEHAGLEAGKRTVSGRSVSIIVKWPQAAAAARAAEAA